ncbi:hypothetical protein ABE29_14475 [Cytobacillus firmus]|nr:hypothetical protein [Cytobacillus firmus]MBG9574209.1 hypothetical protein [Cytobacillus firmus]
MTKYEDWKAFTKIFMKATKKKREKLPKNSSNKNLTQSKIKKYLTKDCKADNFKINKFRKIKSMTRRVR